MIASDVVGVTVGVTDRLFFTGTDTENGDETELQFRWQVICDTGAATQTFPWAEITSGTQFKYDEGGFVATTFPLPDPVDGQVIVTKTASPTVLPVGGIVTYTVTFSNIYTQPLYVDRITDVLPAGVSFIDETVASDVQTTNSAVSPTAGDTATLDWYGVPLPSASKTYVIPAGGSISLVYTASVQNVPGDYTNSVTGFVGATSVGPDTATVTVGEPNLTIDKAHAIDPFVRGSTGSYTITVANNGNAATSGTVTVSDSLPGGLTLSASPTGTGWLCTGNAGDSSFSCTRGDALAPANSYPLITVVVNVGESATNPVTNTALASGGGDPTNASDSDITTITSNSDLSISKSDSADPVTIGDTVTYTISVTNNGPSAASDVTVTDSFSGASFTVTAVSSSQGGCGAFPCNLGSLANGATATITVQGTATGSGTVTNDVTVTATETDPTPANNTDQETTTVNPSADLSISKADSADPVAVGDTVTYTITVTNSGPDTATNVTVTDSFSGASFSVTGISSSQGGCAGFPCNLGSLANGATATITVQGTANGSGTITNDVAVAATETDPTPANNTDQETTTVNPSADLSISKSDSADPVTIGDTVTYTISVTNNDPDTATNVTVTDSFSGASFTMTGVSSSQGACAAFPCNLGSLANGATATITVQGTANGSGTVTNDVTVTATETDPNPANNTDQETTTVNPSADLSISKSDSADPVTIGDTVTYTISVTNNGPDMVTNVTVTDSFSGASFTMTGVSSSQGACAAFPCNLGSLANGATATITVQGTANGSGTVTNDVTVTATETDPNPANNTDQETTTVNPSADLSISKTDNADPVSIGDTVTYTITVTNSGPDTATNVTVTDSFSGASFTVTSVSSSQGGCAGFPCNLGSLANAATATITVQGTANSSGTITNDVAVAATETDPTPANNTDQETTVVGASADLNITKSDNADPVSIGDTVTYTITVTNNGPDSASNVTVTDSFSGASFSVTGISSSQGGCAAFPCNLG